MNRLLRIGSLSKHDIEIEVVSHRFKRVEDYWDGNWLDAKIRIRWDTFSKEVDANLRADEFERFLQELQDFRKGTTKKAKFESMEEWLVLNVSHASKEGFLVKVRAVEKPGSIFKIEFMLCVDENDLDKIESQVKGILEEFPVIGEP